jgi:excisionase family DNA binding protein
LSTTDWTRLPEVLRVDNTIRRRLLSMRDAGRYLSVSEDTLRRLVYEKTLPVVRHTALRGARWFFDVLDLDRYIESRKTRWDDGTDWNDYDQLEQQLENLR